MLNDSAIFHDTDRFAVFSELARLLAQEDIIIRWNVRGMDSPAAMNMAGRVLDVAPIKESEEDKIPGLIFHEVAHFKWSQNMAEELKGGGTALNTAKFNKFSNELEDHHIWNLIEDGYSERQMVRKYPGTLKHFRVLFDSQINDFKKTGDLAIDTINVLAMNAMGVKWGERYDYSKKLPQELISLLERARTINGTHDERADLANKISRMLLKSVVKETKSKRDGVPTISDEYTINGTPAPQSKKKIDVGAIIGGLEIELPQMTKKQKIQFGDDLTERDQLAAVQDASYVKPQAEVAVPPPPQDSIPEPKEDEPQKPVITTAEAVISEPEENNEVIEWDDKDDVGRLEQFISDNAAMILGTNRYFMEKLVDANMENGTDHHIPNYQEIMLTSKVQDIFPENVRTILGTATFNRFESIMKDGDAEKDAKRLFNAFYKKIAQASSVAQSMFQQFTTKANAKNIALTRYRKTGSLDPTRAALFAIYDDVFQKRQLAPNKINHGYVLMVDWSSSMNDSTMELFHRIIELTHFAQLAKIELEVWLYTTAEGLTSMAHLESVGSEIRDNVFLSGSCFTKILNTHQHNPDQILYRLFSLFCAASCVKYMDGIVYAGLRNFDTANRDSFFNRYDYLQHGTNIFEALTFAKHQVAKMKCERKAIMLMTDGEDAGAWSVKYSKRQSHAENIKDCATVYSTIATDTISHLFMDRVDLFEFAKTAHAQLAAANNKYISINPFKSPRTTASFMVAEEARKNGVAVIGITWGSIISYSLSTITRSNIVRVEIPLSDQRKRNLNVYTPVKNSFITSITEALLSNIRQ